MPVVVITPPSAAVTLEEAKLHLRLTRDVEDGLISTFIGAATRVIDGPEGWLGRALAPQVLELRTAASPAAVKLPFPPLIAVQSIKYLDGNDVEQAADPEEFFFGGQNANVLVAKTGSYPWSGASTRGDALRIRYTAGYAQSPTADPLISAVPEPIKAAILLMVGDLYANRETVAAGQMTAIPMSTTVEALLLPYRVWS